MRDAEQEPPRGEGVVPLPCEASREGEAAQAAQGVLYLLSLYSSRLDHLGPLAHFGLLIIGQFDGAHVRRQHAEVLEAGLDFGGGHDLQDFGMQAVHDGLGRARRGENGLPGAHVETLLAGFGNRGYIGQRFQALGAAYGDGAQLAAAIVAEFPAARMG